MRPSQIVELGFGRRAGSGYLLTAQHVLTARHVLDPERQGATGSVRALAPPNADNLKLKRSQRPAEWPAHAAWLSRSHDLAIVKVDAMTMPDFERPRFGRVPREVMASYPCIGTGFPDAAGEYSHQIEARLTWVVDDQRFNLDVVSASPKNWKAWAGLSGAVIFCGGMPVGVIRTVRAGWNGLLTATPVQHLLEDGKFLAFWAGEGFGPPEEQLVTPIRNDLASLPDAIVVKLIAALNSKREDSRASQGLESQVAIELARRLRPERLVDLSHVIDELENASGIVRELISGGERISDFNKFIDTVLTALPQRWATGDLGGKTSSAGRSTERPHVPIEAHTTEIRSEILRYLNTLAHTSAEIPEYYPRHLRSLERGASAFDEIRQIVTLTDNRSDYNEWQLAEIERLRRTKLGHDHVEYFPRHTRANRRRASRVPTLGPETLVWNGRAGDRLQRAILLGDPGFGKSWLLRFEARRLARKGLNELRNENAPVETGTFPVLLRLSDVARHTGPIEEALVTLVGRGYSPEFQRFVRNRLGSDKLMLLLDGWDEAQHQASLRESLQDFFRRFPNQRVLLASRIVGFGISPIPDAVELELLPFGQRELENFARIWFRDHPERARSLTQFLEQHPPLRGLARIPLMLAIICRVFESHSSDLPISRGDLYRTCIWGLLRDWKQTKTQPVPDVVVESTIVRLQSAAERFLTEGKDQFTETELAEALGLDWIDRPTEAQRYVDSLKSDGILAPTDASNSQYTFLHRSFLEYLAARAIARLPSEGKIEILESRSWLPEWREPLIFYAGLAARAGQKSTVSPDPILRIWLLRLLDEKKDDFYRWRLSLAILSLGEVRLQDFDDLADYATEQAFTRARYKLDQRALSVLGALNGRLGPEKIPILSFLVKKITEGSSETAGLHLSPDPPTREFSLDELETDREAAIHYIEALAPYSGSQSGVVEALQAAARDNDRRVRDVAFSAIGALAAAGTVYLPRLISFINDGILSKDDGISQSATQAAHRLGRQLGNHRTLCQSLIAQLSDSDHSISSKRNSAAAALAECGTDLLQLGAVPTLIAAFHDNPDRERYDSAASQFRHSVIGAIKETCTEEATEQYRDIIPTLIKALDDVDHNTQEAAAIGLSQMPGAISIDSDLAERLFECIFRNHYTVEGARETAIVVARSLRRLGVTDEILNSHTARLLELIADTSEDVPEDVAVEIR
jgi:NACHT domain